MPHLHPLVILAVGIFVVLGMILFLRINAFIALITAAVLVSIFSPGPPAEKITRVAFAFGATIGNIGIVIALAAIIGRCLIDSGAADRIVRFFLCLLGEKRGAASLMASGFILSIPVFFDTVFYLLVPLARTMHRRTGRNYLKYLLTIAAGASITHTLVPPTPGPLIVAQTLGVDIGVMILLGLVVAVPSAVVVYFLAGYFDRRLNITMRPMEGAPPDCPPLPDDQLPGLFSSILPIFLPVLLISTHTIISTLVRNRPDSAALIRLSDFAAVVGNPNLAMLFAAAFALIVLARRRKLSRKQLSQIAESALTSAGIIILITAAGGAFGAMLKTAQVGPAIQSIFTDDHAQYVNGRWLLPLAFFVAALLKFSQGSSTVSMITTSAMLGSMITSPDALSFHPVYLAIAIGSGSLVGIWMNDSGFWIFTKMGNLTESETLKSLTPALAVLGLMGLAVTVLLSFLVPLT